VNGSKQRVVLRIPAAQLSVWLCLEIESLSGAAGPAGGLVHPAATPSCTQTTKDNYISYMSSQKTSSCETIATPKQLFCG